LGDLGIDETIIYNETVRVWAHSPVYSLCAIEIHPFTVYVPLKGHLKPGPVQTIVFWIINLGV
jgi:hypothetical protein